MRRVSVLEPHWSKGSVVTHGEVQVPNGANPAVVADLCIPARAKGLVVFVDEEESLRARARERLVARVICNAGVATLWPRYEKCQSELVLACVRWARKHHSGLPIGCYGSSSGVVAAIQAAARAKDLVQALVARGGPVDRCAALLERIEAPVLLIVGGEDRPLLDVNQDAVSRIHGEKDLEIVPGAGHLFVEPGALEAVAHLSADWFLDCFRHSSGIALKPVRAS